MAWLNIMEVAPPPHLRRRGGDASMIECVCADSGVAHAAVRCALIVAHPSSACWHSTLLHPFLGLGRCASSLNSFFWRRLSGWPSPGWLVSWSAGRLVGWPAVGWSAGRLVGWTARRRRAAGELGKAIRRHCGRTARRALCVRAQLVDYAAKVYK